MNEKGEYQDEEGKRFLKNGSGRPQHAYLPLTYVVPVSIDAMEDAD
jgi:hypothetical protein